MSPRYCIVWCWFPLSCKQDQSAPFLTLKGILVETMLMKTPTRSRLGSILYASHLSLLACRVATSLPASNSSGMRLAKRNTLMPCAAAALKRPRQSKMWGMNDNC